jgi:ABC-type multidrug transport system fused ATPase/permease subunit
MRLSARTLSAIPRHLALVNVGYSARPADANPGECPEEVSQMLLAASYPFLNVFWTMCIFFLFVIWLMILFRIFGDIFRRHDIGGGAKTLWVIFVIILPFLGVLIYLLTQNEGMTQRAIERAQGQQAQMDAYVRSVAGGAASEIERAQGLLNSGAITQAEFDTIKAKALAGS